MRKGEITVFLSIIFVLIMSLVGTVIESARVAVGKSVMNKTVSTALESIFSEYNRQVYDNYHIFVLNMIDDSVSSSDDIYENKMNQQADAVVINKLKEYITFSLETSKERNNMPSFTNPDYIELLKCSVNNVDIVDKTHMIDYDGGLFIHEAVQYMKYLCPELLIEELKEKRGDFSSLGKISETVGSNIKAVESLAELSQSLIKLMSLTDGITINSEAVGMGSSLNKTETYFVKQICVESPSMQNMNISNKKVFDTIKNKYVNPLSMLNNMTSDLKKIRSLEKELEDINESMDELIELQNTKQLEIGEQGEEGIYQEDLNDKLMDGLIEKQAEIERKVKKAVMSFNKSKEVLIKLCEEVLTKVEESQNILDEIEVKRSESENIVKQSEQNLLKNKNGMEASYFESLQKEVNGMTDYITQQKQDEGLNLVPQNLDKIRAALNYNYDILNEINVLQRMLDVNSQENNHQLEICSQLKNKYLSYNIKDIRFDYSVISSETDKKNPLTQLDKLLKDGVLSLIFDDTSILSKSVLPEYNLPSFLYTESKNTKQTKKIDDFPKLLSANWKKDNKVPVSSVFEEFSKEIEDSEDTKLAEDNERNNTKLDEELLSSSNNQSKAGKINFINTLIFHEYLLEHFNQIVKLDKDCSVLKPSIEYEMEYLINGNTSDYENISEVISKLLFVRTLSNFLYLLTDSEKSSIAEAFAASIVGFTCLQPLVILAKILLLLVWAYEESLVDVRVIMEGGKVLLFKDKNSFQMGFEELMLLSSQLIKSKAEEVLKLDQQIGFDYKDYLRFFLNFNSVGLKAFRSMDLIQCNINKNGEQDFLFSNTLFSCTIDVSYKIKTLLPHFPGVKNMLGERSSDYQVLCREIYSY